MLPPASGSFPNPNSHYIYAYSPLLLPHLLKHTNSPKPFSPFHTNLQHPLEFSSLISEMAPRKPTPQKQSSSSSDEQSGSEETNGRIDVEGSEHEVDQEQTGSEEEDEKENAQKPQAHSNSAKTNDEKNGEDSDTYCDIEGISESEEDDEKEVTQKPQSSSSSEETSDTETSDSEDSEQEDDQESSRSEEEDDKENAQKDKSSSDSEETNDGKNGEGSDHEEDGQEKQSRSEGNDEKENTQKPSDRENSEDSEQEDDQEPSGSEEEDEKEKTQKAQSSSDSEDSSGPDDKHKSSKKPPTLKKPSAKPGTKRPAEEHTKNGSDGPRKRIKVTGVKKPNRLFSKDDEVVILKGILDFKTKNGSDAFAEKDEFHWFVKNDLSVNVNQNQLKDKARRLRKKYEAVAEKSVNGFNPASNKHEHKCLQLWKKICKVSVSPKEDTMETVAKSVTAKKKAKKASTKNGVMEDDEVHQLGGDHSNGNATAKQKKSQKGRVSVSPKEDSMKTVAKSVTAKKKAKKLHQLGGDHSTGNAIAKQKKSQKGKVSVSPKEDSMKTVAKSVTAKKKAKKASTKKGVMEDDEVHQLGGDHSNGNATAKLKKSQKGKVSVSPKEDSTEEDEVHELGGDHSNGTAKKKKSQKREVLASPKVNSVEEEEVPEEDFFSEFPQLKRSLENENRNLSMGESVMSSLKEIVPKIGHGSGKKLEGKWKSFRAEQTSLFLKQLDLVREQTQLVLNAMKAEDS